MFKIPVSREHCAKPSDNSACRFSNGRGVWLSALIPDETKAETVSVTHQIRFSMMTPARLRAFEQVIDSPGAKVTHNSSDFERNMAHDNWQHMGASRGQDLASSANLSRTFR